MKESLCIHRASRGNATNRRSTARLGLHPGRPPSGRRRIAPASRAVLPSPLHCFSSLRRGPAFAPLPRVMSPWLRVIGWQWFRVRGLVLLAPPCSGVRAPIPRPSDEPHGSSSPDRPRRDRSAADEAIRLRPKHARAHQRARAVGGERRPPGRREQRQRRRRKWQGPGRTRGGVLTRSREARAVGVSAGGKGGKKAATGGEKQGARDRADARQDLGSKADAPPVEERTARTRGTRKSIREPTGAVPGPGRRRRAQGRFRGSWRWVAPFRP